jgi:hypothetical protein
MPGALDGADVHERVVAAAFRLNEAVALVRVEKFHDADRHKPVPCLAARRQPARQVPEAAKRRKKEPQSAKDRQLRL